MISKLNTCFKVFKYFSMIERNYNCETNIKERTGKGPTLVPLEASDEQLWVISESESHATWEDTMSVC